MEETRQVFEVKLRPADGSDRETNDALLRQLLVRLLSDGSFTCVGVREIGPEPEPVQQPDAENVAASEQWYAQLGYDLGRAPTKEDLVEYGASLGIELDMSMRKDEMVAAIDEQGWKF